MGGENERMKELSDENRNAKEQVALVQERVRALQQEVLAKETQLAAARQDVQELRVHAVRTTVYRPDQSRLMTDTRSTSRPRFRRYLYTPAVTRLPSRCCSHPD